MMRWFETSRGEFIPETSVRRLVKEGGDWIAILDDRRERLEFFEPEELAANYVVSAAAGTVAVIISAFDSGDDPRHTVERLSVVAWLVDQSTARPVFTEPLAFNQRWFIEGTDGCLVDDCGGRYTIEEAIRTVIREYDLRKAAAKKAA